MNTYGVPFALAITGFDKRKKAADDGFIVEGQRCRAVAEILALQLGTAFVENRERIGDCAFDNRTKAETVGDPLELGLLLRLGEFGDEATLELARNPPELSEHVGKFALDIADRTRLGDAVVEGDIAAHIGGESENQIAFKAKPAHIARGHINERAAQ